MTFRYLGINWQGRRWSCPAAIRSFGDQLVAEYPVRLNTAADGTVASKAHDLGPPLNYGSDHHPQPRGADPAEVRAIDFGVSREQGDRVTEALRVSRDRRIKYVIYNGRRFSQAGGWVWTPYTGSNPHARHGHLSTLEQYDDDGGPWSLGGDEDMPLTPEEIAAIAKAVWQGHPITHPVTGEQRGAQKLLADAVAFSAQAASRGATLTPEQVAAIADAVSDEVAEDVADELSSRLEG